MPISQTDLANRALQGEVGLAPINDIDGSDENSQKCKIAYTTVKEELLEETEWKFAERRVSLALVSGVDIDEFTYSYGYPSDCISIRRIYNSSDPTKQLPYTTTTDVQKQLRYLHANCEDAILIYTANVDDVNLMKPLFRKALVLGMASKLAQSIKRDLPLSGMLSIKAADAFAAASVADSKEEYVEPPANDTFIDARGDS